MNSEIDAIVGKVAEQEIQKALAKIDIGSLLTKEIQATVTELVSALDLTARVSQAVAERKKILDIKAIVEAATEKAITLAIEEAIAAMSSRKRRAKPEVAPVISVSSDPAAPASTSLLMFAVERMPQRVTMPPAMQGGMGGIVATSTS